MFEIINYLSLISRGGGGGTSPPQPRETPEEFQQRYDEAYDNLVNAKRITDRNITNMFSKPQVKRLLDVMLNENIHYVGHNQKAIMFEERTLLPDGTENVTDINISIASFKQMDKKNSITSLEDLMETYYDVPLYQRQFASAVNFGTIDKFQRGDPNGGLYEPFSKTVCVNATLLTNEYGNTKEWAQLTLYHEFTHATDFNVPHPHTFLSGVSTTSNKFKNIMENSWASSYSESYGKGTNSWYQESLAEAVAYTKQANVLGGNNVYVYRPDIRDGKVYAGERITYNQWKSENSELAKFASDYVECKNTNDLQKLFGKLEQTY